MDIFHCKCLNKLFLKKCSFFYVFCFFVYFESFYLTRRMLTVEFVSYWIAREFQHLALLPERLTDLYCMAIYSAIFIYYDIHFFRNISQIAMMLYCMPSASKKLWRDHRQQKQKSTPLRSLQKKSRHFHSLSHNDIFFWVGKRPRQWTC